MKKSMLMALLLSLPAISLAQGGPPPGKGPGAARMLGPPPPPPVCEGRA